MWHFVVWWKYTKILDDCSARICKRGRVTSAAHSNEKLVNFCQAICLYSLHRGNLKILVQVVGVLAKVKPHIFKWKSRSVTSWWYILLGSISVKYQSRLWSVFLYLIWSMRDYWQITVKIIIIITTTTTIIIFIIIECI
jgi:hypothetical protein